MLGDDLGGKRGGGRLEEGGSVCEGDRLGHALEDLDRGFGSALERLGDDRGMQS